MNILDKQIKAAIAGMTYPSEGDPQPLEHLRWNTQAVAIDEPTVRQWSGEGDKPPLSIGNYQAFMEPRMTTGDQQSEYQALNEIMTTNLVGLTVFRFDEIQVRIYVIGIDALNNIVGWQTTAIQT